MNQQLQSGKQKNEKVKSIPVCVCISDSQLPMLMQSAPEIPLCRVQGVPKK